MTATERLRELLDERGAEWTNGVVRCHTTHCLNRLGHTTTAQPWCEGTLKVTMYDLTPEQAIAATLGKEPDDTAMLKLHDRMNAVLLEYERVLGNEKADGAITVPFVVEMHQLLEEAATLGGGYQGFWTHDGTLHIELPKLPESILVRLPDKRDREVRSARVWRYTLGDADATGERHGVGTCHISVQDNLAETEGMGDVWLECDACNWQMPLEPSTPRFNFCPNCGKRVVE